MGTAPLPRLPQIAILPPGSSLAGRWWEGSGLRGPGGKILSHWEKLGAKQGQRGRQYSRGCPEFEERKLVAVGAAAIGFTGGL